MNKPTISLQIYTFKEEFLKDPQNAIKLASELGYQAIELFYYDRIPEAEKIVKWLKEAGIACSGNNVNWADILPENILNTLNYCKTVGTNRIAVGSAPPQILGKRKAMKEIIRTLKEAYKIAKAAGFQIGYHTHYTDFVMVDGISVWDRIFLEMPEDFYMILDTGNAAAGGGDSLHYLQEYPQRSPWVHLKPYHEKYGAATMIGEDSFDWQELVKASLEKGGADTLVIEYSHQGIYTPQESAKLCYERINEVLEIL